MLFCACGKSKKDPICDNSHVGTGKKPISFVPPKDDTFSLCRCKFSQKMPLCDLSHRKKVEELLNW